MQVDAVFEGHVMDDPGGVVVKMPVLGQVRAKPRWTTVEVHLPDDAVLHHRIQTRVNRRQRYIGQAVLDPHEHVIGRRMVTVLLQYPINLLPLARHAQARDLIRNRRFTLWVVDLADHRGGKVRALQPRSRIIPDYPRGLHDPFQPSATPTTIPGVFAATRGIVAGHFPAPLPSSKHGLRY